MQTIVTTSSGIRIRLNTTDPKATIGIVSKDKIKTLTCAPVLTKAA